MAEGKRPEHDDIGTLPITGEIGSEGGTYGDAATQTATRTGDAPAVEGSPPAPNPAVSEAAVPAPDSPEDGVRRHGGSAPLPQRSS